MSNDRRFPVLWQGSREYKAKLVDLGCPHDVPWDFVASHDASCHANHDQSAQCLAERGGLGPNEILAVLDATPNWKGRLQAWGRPPEETVPELLRRLDEWALRAEAPKP
jgi:hypothetical protein